MHCNNLENYDGKNLPTCFTEHMNCILEPFTGVNLRYSAVFHMSTLKQSAFYPPLPPSTKGLFCFRVKRSPLNLPQKQNGQLEVKLTSILG